MMKCVFLFLFPLILFSQSNIKVTYKADIIINLDSIDGPSNFKNIFKRSIDKAKLIDFTLLINVNDSIALFSKENRIEIENSISRLDELTINQLLGTKGKYYYLKNKVVHDYNIMEKNLKVEIDKKVVWTLLNEQKKIGSYDCYKAIGISQYGKNKGDKVEAWYTMSIPLSYGPKNYAGLPGLIVEIREKKAIFHIEKLEYLKDIEINFPKQEAIISEKKAQKIINEMNERAEDYFKGRQ
jgi:GLPGLI family protein